MLSKTAELKKYASKLGVCLDDEQLNKFSLYFDAVVDGNKQFNLTAILQEDDFLIKHFVDSLAGVDQIPQNASLIDIGSGAGFPSVPIAIARKDVRVTAIDSTSKKMNFVLTQAKLIGIDNITTIAGRAEDQQKLFGTFDAASARAVSSLQVLLELVAPLLKVGGVFISYKTDESEIAASQNAMKVLSMKLKNTKVLKLPNGDSRAILVFEKTAQTPSCYPRQYGTIKKKPL